MAEFTETVATMRGGTDRIASAALAAVVSAVRATGNQGTVTLKITVAMLENGDGELRLKGKVSVGLPTEDIKDSIYYATEDGRLSRIDPRQMTMLPDRTEAMNRELEATLNGVGRGPTVIDMTANRA